MKNSVTMEQKETEIKHGGVLMTLKCVLLNQSFPVDKASWLRTGNVHFPSLIGF